MRCCNKKCSYIPEIYVIATLPKARDNAFIQICPLGLEPECGDD